MTPRIFLIRHGETQWSAEQRHTGSTDVPLTENGHREVERTKDIFVGPGRLINPANIRHIYCSPRGRAQKTSEILFPTITGTSQEQGVHKFEIMQSLQEWDYGEYEGLTRDQVIELRLNQGLSNARDWNIFRDGCADGESSDSVLSRLQYLVSTIKNEIMKTTLEQPQGNDPQDIVCIAHGHILSSLAMVWANIPLKDGVRLVFQTAGVAVLGFEHNDLNEPAVLVGIHPN